MEAWTVLLAWLIGVVGACVCGVLAAQGVAEAGAHQRGERRRVEARLTADTPKDTASAPEAGEGRVSAPVRWTDAHGRPHSGTTLVDAGLRAGARLEVWTGPRGELEPRPVNHGESLVGAGVGATVASLGWCLVVVGGTHLVGLRIDRGRMRAWERDWEEFDRAHRGTP
ncbi:hypothetical protein AB0910_21200 [Streptomyces sp. NPDC047002]|uniref:Rv1733c family protein n=1 Tax=Streptomyces sp. NPDC047002 TaxID=3155475 RepID=UPI0034561FD5